MSKSLSENRRGLSPFCLALSAIGLLIAGIAASRGLHLCNRSDAAGPAPTPATGEGSDAVATAANRLTDPDVETRRSAAKQLGETGFATPSAIPALLDALADQDAEVRWRAEFAIGRVGAKAVSPLVEALKAQQPQRRRSAAMMLGPIGPKARSAIPALAAATTDADPQVRCWSVKSIGDIGFEQDSPQVLAALTKNLRDPDLNVRRVSVVVVAGLGPRAAATVPVLIDGLKDADREIRWKTGIAMRQMGPAAKDAVPALIETLADPDPDVQFRAAQALGRIGPTARPALEAAANSESTRGQTRAYAADVLRQLDAEQNPAAELAAPLSAEAQAARDERTRWFNEAKFGIFIHWGLFSVPAHARPGELAEWVMNNDQIPPDQYEKLAAGFTAANFQPAEWVRLFKDTGARYVVLTSKHHDGFCLWDSQVNPYNVPQRAAARRDVLGELAAACQQGGIKFCAYYSLLDWHDPDFTANFPRYVEHMHGQLRELLTNYPIWGLWFDGEWPHSMSEWRGAEIVSMIRQLKPLAVVNDRLGRETRSKITSVDYYTKEQEIPDSALRLANRPVAWETCQTFGYSWGYDESPDPLKSGERLIEQMVEVVSKGGNFLLNIGPRPDGTIPPQLIARMKTIGEFLRVNGEAIYGTSRSPFGGPLKEGRVTTKANRLYIFLESLPQHPIQLPRIHNRVTRAWLLDGGDPLKTWAEGDINYVAQPQRLSKLPFTVVAIELDGPVSVAP